MTGNLGEAPDSPVHIHVQALREVLAEYHTKSAQTPQACYT